MSVYVVYFTNSVTAHNTRYSQPSFPIYTDLPLIN